MAKIKKLVLGCLMILGLSMFVYPLDFACAQEKVQAKRIMPSYKPPLRGAPSGRIGGGTRGEESTQNTSIYVLTPDHTGLTLSDSPCLYWYMSGTAQHPLELTVIEHCAVSPLLETTISNANRGINHLCLKQYDIKLTEGKIYKWFVTQVVDPEMRSKDLLSGGLLQFVLPEPGQKETLAQAKDDMEKAGVFAAESYWYDALDTISKLIEASPNDTELKQWRSTLLSQVGFNETTGFSIQ